MAAAAESADRALVRRFVRTMARVCLVLAGAALAWAPQRPLLAAGVVGGGALAGLALWGIAGLVHGLGPGADTGAEHGENRPVPRGFQLVKFFTRHAILAFAAYVMMVRLHLDPVGMLVGVTSVVAAAAREAARPR